MADLGMEDPASLPAPRGSLEQTAMVLGGCLMVVAGLVAFLTLAALLMFGETHDWPLFALSLFIAFLGAKVCDFRSHRNPEQEHPEPSEEKRA